MLFFQPLSFHLVKALNLLIALSICDFGRERERERENLEEGAEGKEEERGRKKGKRMKKGKEKRRPNRVCLIWQATYASLDRT